jgi:hypothetical protein
LSGEPLAELNSFERANLYVALHVYFSWLADSVGEPPVEVLNFFESLGVELPRRVSRETVEYIKRYRAGIFRTDLNLVAREFLKDHLTALYRAAGYVLTEPADSLLAMTAFAARLAINAYISHIKGDKSAEKFERQLHRFIKTHLIPALEHVKPPEKIFSNVVEELTQIIKDDAKLLAARLSRQTSL